MTIAADSDTIVAVATSASYTTAPEELGSICVIRMSGSDAFSIAGTIFRGIKPFNEMKPYTVGYGFIVEPAELGGTAGLGGTARQGETTGQGSTAGLGSAAGQGETTGQGSTAKQGGTAELNFSSQGQGVDELASAPCHGAVRAVDEVLIIKMRAPKSYTREDVVEIHCHAGISIQRNILRIILACGARAAAPGEFTKRAFLNGRIDLSQAEAVMDLIRAKSDAGASMAMRQLEGALSGMLGSMREALIGLIASLEAFLDFPEYEVDERSIAEVDGELGDIEQSLRKLAESFEYGRVARDGLTAAIIGRPNVGKSTLFNLLAGRERAIVTDIPGTTRDVIDEYVHLGRFTVRFLDTAGIRETDDAVERIGVDRAIGAIGQADIALLLFGADEGFCGSDAQLIKLTEGKKRIFIINKTDLAEPGAVDALREAITEAAVPGAPPHSIAHAPAPSPVASPAPSPAASHMYEVVEASLINGDGLSNIEGAVHSLFAGHTPPGYGDAALANARHYALVMRGFDAVHRARAALGAGLPLEMPIIDMREALSSLGEITGETYSDDIIDRIFSEFCIGK
ncbi:MAG: tRNA uridine-5-carboxymethylaminomethyl(34) synthesis GTPase MnmE [Oscillospiraceae bacterium]|nr:tRNA uridine-5-carboxymethylaminomethyl(34) synthesis GTPase MnmE [Oscillospiraceae bacterium]